jgi:hypothetical protein
MKINDIDALKSQLERYMTDLRAIQTESNLLDRLMEESNTTITDSTTNRNIFFVVESRTVQNLVDTIENKVNRIVAGRWKTLFSILACSTSRSNSRIRSITR